MIRTSLSREGKRLYDTTLTIRRIVTDVSIIVILLGFGLFIWEGTRATPVIHPALFFVGGGLLAMLIQVVGPPLVRAVFPRHVLALLPLDVLSGPIPEGTPRGYRDLIRIWRRRS